MSDDGADIIGSLEFAARAYEVATQYLIDEMQKAGEDVPQRILNALMNLVTTINEEWP